MTPVAAGPATGEFERWLSAVETRHLRNLTFSEIRRAVQALSGIYVERRHRLSAGAALGSAGKRAAFAVYFAPLHFLIVRAIVRGLGLAANPPSRIVDLGCGTGAAGAAWALECDPRPALVGLDRSPWAVAETRWTYRALGLSGQGSLSSMERVRVRGEGQAFLAAFALNELTEPVRTRLRDRLLEARQRGVSSLIVEPIARRELSWWEDWSAAWRAAGGRDDTWRVPGDLPQSLRLMDRAAGLDHRELKARSLWLGPDRQAVANR
jgi:hypothetical protein